MQNNLSDLNNHLFAQLELLGNGELSNEELEAEITRKCRPFLKRKTAKRLRLKERKTSRSYWGLQDESRVY